MKALFLSLLFLIPLFSQDAGEKLKYFDAGAGFFINDSLYQDYTGVTDSMDTIDEIDLGFGYDFVTITAIDTGTTYTDSVIVEYALPGFDKGVSTSGLNFKQVDSTTIWQRVQFMRDSSWTNTNLIPDNASVKSYQIYVGSYDKIRIRMINAAVVAGRVFYYRVSASKKAE